MGKWTWKDDPWRGVIQRDGVTCSIDEALDILNGSETMLEACKEAFGVLTEPGMLDIDMWKSWKQSTVNKLDAAIAAAEGRSS